MNARNPLPLLLALLLVRPAGAAFYAAAGKADITPDPTKRVYLAGYGDKGRRAKGVHDPLYARAIVVSDGRNTAALVVLDLIGFFHEDVLKVRAELGLDPVRHAVLVASTHDHSGPDTLGLWGPMLGVSGVDQQYQAHLRRQVAKLVKDLHGSLQEAEIVSAVRPIEMKGLCRDSRDPVVMDPDLGAVRFLSKRDGKTIGTLVNWSCHPEVLARENDLLTADYPGALCARIERDTGGACAFFSGSIGGLQTPDTEALRAGLKDDFAAMEKLGEALAKEVEASLRAGQRSKPEKVVSGSRAFRLRVENSKYLTFLPILAFGHAIYDADGERMSKFRMIMMSLRHAFFRLRRELYPEVETEVQHISFGPVDLLGIPGEILPELVLGGYDGSKSFGYPVLSPSNPNPPDLKAAPKGPYLKERMKGRHRMIIGLANDEIGYILPEYDFKTSGALLMRPFPPGHHYEESNSVGKGTAERVLKAAKELLER